jgi:two-component system sensor histidine kinase RpfC
MPVMGGIEAAKIYNFTVTPDERIPILILTANATIEAQRECEDANIDAFHTKPIEAARLIQTINELTNNKPKGITYDDTTISNENFRVEQPGLHSEPNRLIDNNILRSLAELASDHSFLPSLIEGYVRDTESLLIQMEKSLANKNVNEFLDSVHALKGSSGSIGAIKLQEICTNILADKATNTDHIRSLKIMNDCYQASKQELIYAANKHADDSSAKTGI